MRHIKILILFIVFAILGSLVVLAAQKYRIETGSNLWINEHGVCKNVANASGHPIMVPTHTSTGWASFYNNAHSGVTMTNPTCPDASTVACDVTVTNECGVSCGYVGTNNCYTYTWMTGSWGGCTATWTSTTCDACTVSCGGGTQNCTKTCADGTETRSVWCQRNDGVTVADSYCTDPKPATSQSCTCSGSSTYTQSCNTHLCGVPFCSDVAATCKGGDAPAGYFRLNEAGSGCGAGDCCDANGNVTGTGINCPCAQCQ